MERVTGRDLRQCHLHRIFLTLGFSNFVCLKLRHLVFKILSRRYPTSGRSVRLVCREQLDIVTFTFLDPVNVATLYSTTLSRACAVHYTGHMLEQIHQVNRNFQDGLAPVVSILSCLKSLLQYFFHYNEIPRRYVKWRQNSDRHNQESDRPSWCK